MLHFVVRQGGGVLQEGVVLRGGLVDSIKPTVIVPVEADRFVRPEAGGVEQADITREVIVLL